MALKDLFRNYIYPTAVLSGSIIGVGFLSLPYIASKIGIWMMLFYFLVLSFMVLAIHLIFGQICLKTPDFKRWPGFVEFYFGKASKVFILPLIIFGIFGVMLVYLIIGSEFLHSTFSSIVSGSPSFYMFLYWFLASSLIFIGVKAISKVDFLALLLLFGSLIFIFLKGLPYINLDNLIIPSFKFQISNFLLPYGPILFSLWGTGLIPEVEEMIRGKKQSLYKVIALSTIIPVIFYLLFIFLTLSITGSQTTESSLIGIKNILGNGFISFILLIGVMTTFIAFIAQGLLLKKIFMYDMHMKELAASFLVCLVPLLLFFIGFRSFISIISFIGGVLLGIEGILIMLIYRKIGGWKIIAYPLTLIFILGIIYSIVYFSK